MIKIHREFHLANEKTNYKQMKTKIISIALLFMCAIQLQAAKQLRYTINESWQFNQRQ